MKFSVVMACHGGSDIKKFDIALSSIIDQTTQPSEIIIVCDGKIDNPPLENRLNEINRQGRIDNIVIKILKSSKNFGPGKARNLGVSEANYDIIFIMDDDDFSVKNRFELQLLRFEMDAELAVLGGNIEEIWEEGEKKPRQRSRRIVSNQKLSKQDLNFGSPMNNVTLSFRKHAFVAVGGYIDLRAAEDYALITKFILNGYKCLNLDDVLVKVSCDYQMLLRRGSWCSFRSEIRFLKWANENGVFDSRGKSLHLIKAIFKLIMPSWMLLMTYKLQRGMK